MQHVLFVFFLLLTSLLYALIEIQIEGSDGWATSLPTWRFESRLSRVLLGNRSITGYHVFTHLFILSILHVPYALGTSFSLAIELRIMAFAFLFWVVEDFLWFLCNPAYGIRGFTPERAWWHAPNWWWIMPRDYWLFVPLGCALYALSFVL